ncbi:MAG: glutamate--tRNA ligase [Bacillota bacterium]|nr:glutamate--tRNA ligase [Bacillota bacterium]
MENRVRFAPSPTGYLHIGGLRTALYDYLFAKQTGGKYILRIEDTDQTRLVEGAIEGIIDASAWAGVHHDEGPYIQSQRLPIYKKWADYLLEQGHAYCCFCSKERLEEVRAQQTERGENPKYDGHCRHLSMEEVQRRIAAGEEHVVRLKLPENRVIEFHDLIKGDISVNTNDLDDQVLMKSDGFPTYHMAVVVDDHEMGITHVLRGDEWLISTPKHIYLYEAFGWQPPAHVHLPVILGTNKKKLSKRQGDVAVEDFRRKGYLPEALVNYIALVGWSPEGDSEIMTMEEMIEKFSFDRVSKSGGIFDIDKLKWMNNHYLRQADLDRLTDLSRDIFIESGYTTEDSFERDFDKLRHIISLLRERLGCLDEIRDYYAFFNADEVLAEDAEAEAILALPQIPILAQTICDKCSSLTDLRADAFKAMLKEVQAETGYKGKDLFMPVRVALTGSVHGPDLALTAEVLGVERIVKRLRKWC